jgi:uncharacterized protein (DUF924 family)
MKNSEAPHHFNQARAIQDFWFGAPDAPDYGQPRQFWFKKSAQTDALIRQKFEPLLSAAKQGAFDAWVETPEGALALMVLLDQFSRNIYRDTADAFAADEKARWVANLALARGCDQAVLPIQRVFFYLPFEHSESLADQACSVQLFRRLLDCGEAYRTYYDFALRHFEIIQAYGRFPHRNRILGRPSTAPEEAFLLTPGSGF